MWSADSDEVQVLRRLALGEDTRRIAAELGWSEASVKRLIHRIKLTLGAVNRTHAVYLATKQGLL